MKHVARAIRIGSALASVAWLSACDGLTAPTTTRVVGVIGLGDSRTVVLEAPDSMRLGEATQVRVTTYGSGSCTRAAGAELRVTGLVAEITPIDREQRSGACTSDLRSYARDVGVRFDVAGVATIRVRGRSQYRASDGRDSLVVRERTVVVRP